MEYEFNFDALTGRIDLSSNELVDFAQDIFNEKNSNARYAAQNSEKAGAGVLSASLGGSSPGNSSYASNAYGGNASADNSANSNSVNSKFAKVSDEDIKKLTKNFLQHTADLMGDMNGVVSQDEAEKLAILETDKNNAISLSELINIANAGLFQKAKLFLQFNRMKNNVENHHSNKQIDDCGSVATQAKIEPAKERFDNLRNIGFSIVGLVVTK